MRHRCLHFSPFVTKSSDGQTFACSWFMIYFYFLLFPFKLFYYQIHVILCSLLFLCTVTVSSYSQNVCVDRRTDKGKSKCLPSIKWGHHKGCFIIHVFLLKNIIYSWYYFKSIIKVYKCGSNNQVDEQLPHKEDFIVAMTNEDSQIYKM